MKTGEYMGRSSSLRLGKGEQTQLRAAERDSGPRDGGRKDPQLLTGETGQQVQDRFDPLLSTDACLLQQTIIAARDTQP